MLRDYHGIRGGTGWHWDSAWQGYISDDPHCDTVILAGAVRRGWGVFFDAAPPLHTQLSLLEIAA